MELKAWDPWYRQILQTFGYSEEKDQRAAAVLSELLQGRALAVDDLRRLIHNRPTIILGAGPSLEENIRALRRENLLMLCATVTSDGATGAFLKFGEGFPMIIVSDLDGSMEDILNANRMGSYVVVHAHGDNIPALREYVPFLRNVLGTTQVRPSPNLYNFGGFTDGDRSFFLSIELGASAIALAGMDLGDVVGTYSKFTVKNLDAKLRKLRMCKELLEWGAHLTKANLVNLTGRGEKIKGFQDVTITDYAKAIKRKYRVSEA